MKTKIHWYETIDSTNDEARRLAENGERGPLCIAARAQTAGRGRRGRPWISKPGNLFASFLVSPDRLPDECAQLSFAAALAVGETIEAYAPKVELMLKWPNDVLLGGRKVAGVLLESQKSGQARRLDWLIVGIGINVIEFPVAVEFPATALSTHMQYPPSAEEILPRLADRWVSWYEIWMVNGFTEIKESWLRRAKGLGTQIRVRLDAREINGKFEGLDEDGALLLRTSTGLMQITAGDVFF